MTRHVSVVPHTHWDREWYSSFQSFRMRLVDLVDDLLALMESDPSYARFLLDGQMAVVDDYLEVRPENEQRIRNLAASKRLTMGPWYILLDEFLVSGETIIRDLQLGMLKATNFGGAMPVGYLPDMFGHVAQMPQIFAQAGFKHAAVWRGVPSVVGRRAFEWVAPDGSSVRCEYLPLGYSNGAGLPDDAKALIGRVQGYLDEIVGLDKDGESVLIMNGTDHQKPVPFLGKVVSEANGIQSDFVIRIESLLEALEKGPNEGLPVFQGELRSGWRSNLLMGVTSNRIDVRGRAAVAERLLEKLAEPLCALVMESEKWPTRFLEIAWKLMIQNSAHDSVCACSVDEVVDAVLVRYQEAAKIAEGLIERAKATASQDLAGDNPVFINTSNRQRTGLVEFTVDGKDAPVGTQVILRSGGGGFGGAAISLTVKEVSAILGQLNGQALDDHTFVTGISTSVVGDDINVTIQTGPKLDPTFSADDAKRDVAALLLAHPDGMVNVLLDVPDQLRLIAMAKDVPGFGWKKFVPKELSYQSGVSEGENIQMTNGLVTVIFDSNDGTFSINGIEGFNRLVDMGDHGDTYNYSPPDNDVVVDTPSSVTISVLESGPVRSEVEVTRSYLIPQKIDGAKRSRVGQVDLVVVSRVELRAEEDMVRVTTSFTNTARDHRLRVHFPLGVPADHSMAESAFTAVERPLVAEGGPTEKPLPTHPALRFVRAGNTTILHDRVLEYELVDIREENGVAKAHEVAVTLLRATGMLSQITMTNRPLAAGPPLPAEGAEMLKHLSVSYGISLSDRDPYDLSEDFNVPLQVLEAKKDSDVKNSGSDCGHWLELSGARVSSLRRVSGLIEIRVFNPTSETTKVEIPSRTGWLVDLTGREVSFFEGHFDLAPYRFATVRLDR